MTFKGNTNDEDANLTDEVSQCKGPETGWGWCIGGTARVSVWLGRCESEGKHGEMRWERCEWRTLSRRALQVSPIET